jgi:hypothetical protein
MRPRSPWTEEATATLRRMASAGYTDGEIARHLGRDRTCILRKRQRLRINPGLPPAMIAMLARISMRRRLAA